MIDNCKKVHDFKNGINIPKKSNYKKIWIEFEQNEIDKIINDKNTEYYVEIAQIADVHSKRGDIMLDCKECIKLNYHPTIY